MSGELEGIEEEREIAKSIMLSGNFFLIAYDFPEKPPKEFYYRYHKLREYYPSDLARIQYSVAVSTREDLARTISYIVQQLGGFVIIAFCKTVKEISAYYPIIPLGEE